MSASPSSVKCLRNALSSRAFTHAAPFLVILLVCLEPLAGIVFGEGGEEGEGLLVEVTVGHFVGSLMRCGASLENKCEADPFSSPSSFCIVYIFGRTPKLSYLSFWLECLPQPCRVQYSLLQLLQLRQQSLYPISHFLEQQHLPLSKHHLQS